MLLLTVPLSGTTLTPHPHPWTPKRGRDSEACRRGPVTFRTWCLSSQISHLRSAKTRFPRAPALPRAFLCPLLHTDRGTPEPRPGGPGSPGLGPWALPLSQSTPLPRPNQLLPHAPLSPYRLPSSGPGPSVAGRPQRQLPSLLPSGPQASRLPSTQAELSTFPQTAPPGGPLFIRTPDSTQGTALPFPAPPPPAHLPTCPCPLLSALRAPHSHPCRPSSCASVLTGTPLRSQTGPPACSGCRWYSARGGEAAVSRVLAPQTWGPGSLSPALPRRTVSHWPTSSFSFWAGSTFCARPRPSLL